MANHASASFPGFSSFPDLDAPGPSKHQHQARDRIAGSEGTESKHRENKKRAIGNEKDKKRHKEKHSYDAPVEKVERQKADLDTKSSVYFRDAKGDDLNVTYGFLDAKAIPKYREIAGGKQVLGLKSTLTVLYKGSKGIEIGERVWYSKAPQLSDSRTRAQLANEQVVRLEASAKTHLKYIEVDGFIKLPSAKGKEKELEYRSITRDNYPSSSSDSSNSSMEESTDEDEVRTLSAREEAIQSLERKLAKTPTSVNDWLMLLEESIKNVSILSKNAENARAEVALSILERTLAAHPDNKRSVRLQLKLLRLGESVWQRNQLDEEWDRALKDAPSEDLCVEWLDWRIRTATNFDEALSSVSNVMQRVANLGLDDFDRVKLRIFWRVAILFQQAGYIERGFALFQVQAELTYKLPAKLRQKSLEEKLDALEEFWDSEAMRVGEEGSRGWASWQSEVESSAPVARTPIVRSSCSNAYDDWHDTEMQSDERLLQPERMQTEEGDGGDEDPYSAILFSDIRPYLLEVHTDVGQQLFRLMWLSYLGLNIPGLSTAFVTEKVVATDDRWANAAFMRSDFLRRLYPNHEARGMVTSDSFAGAIVGREKAYEDPFEAVKAWGFDSFDPFSAIVGDRKCALWSKKDLVGFSDERLDTIRNVFIQLKLGREDTKWDTLRLAFEAVNPRCNSVQKISQAALSENSSSPSLLAAHARLERLNGKFDKARKVYRIGIDSLSQTSEPGIAYLSWGLAEMEWLRGQEDVALAALYQAAGQRSTERSGIHVLKAKRRLEELSRGATAGDWKLHLQWQKLRILFELLNGGLEAAMDLANKLREDTQGGTPALESLLVESSLIFYHFTITLRNHARPALLRDFIADAMRSYPDNSIIFGLFLECEKGESVWGRVKALIEDNLNSVLGGKSVSRLLLEIWTAKWEIGYWAGEVERVRSGFEACVISDRTKGSPILWKAYAIFEMQASEPKKAKAVLYRAIRECPLVKDLYMLAFDSKVRSVYTARELAALSDTLSERGIRVRRSLDEVLEEMGEPAEQIAAEGLDVGGETELEHASREQRRLMPY